jgi:hypothetical protein
MPCPICQKEHASDVPEILNRLASAPRRLEKAAASANPRRVSIRPAPGKWSAREIICHLADCEVVYGVRYRKILAEPDPVLVPFDQDAWAANLQYRNQPIKTAVAAFCALRNSHVALFRRMPEENWEKAGIHQSYGSLTLRQIASHLVEHDRNHLAQIERLLPPVAEKRVEKPARNRAKPKIRKVKQ